MNWSYFCLRYIFYFEFAFAFSLKIVETFCTLYIQDNLDVETIAFHSSSFFSKKFFFEFIFFHRYIFLFIMSFITIFRLRTRCLFNRSEYTPRLRITIPKLAEEKPARRTKLGNGIKKSVIPTRSQFVASHTHVVTRARLHKIARVFAVIWLPPWIWPEVVSRELCERHYDVAWKGMKKRKKKKKKKERKKEKENKEERIKRRRNGTNKRKNRCNCVKGDASRDLPFLFLHFLSLRV